MNKLFPTIPIERGIFAFTMIYIYGTCINKTYGNTGQELQKQHRINPCAEINIKSIGKTIILDQCIIIISHIYIYVYTYYILYIFPKINHSIFPNISGHIMWEKFEAPTVGMI